MSGGVTALDIRRLRTLERVAALGSFSRAADELHFTQSAVSQQVASLERDLGVRLVNRQPVSLTPPGQILCERFASALAELAAAQAELASFRARDSGALRIAAVGAAAAHLVPAAAAAFAARFPDVVVHVQQCGPADAVTQLQRGGVELALTFERERRSATRLRVRWVRLTHERIWLAVPASHALARTSGLRLAQLHGERFVHSASAGIPVEALVDAAGGTLTSTVVFAGDNPRAVHAMVARGAGLALVPDFDVQDVPGVAHVRLVDPPLARSMHAAVLDYGSTSTTVEAMLDELVFSARRVSTPGISRCAEPPRRAARAARARGSHASPV